MLTLIDKPGPDQVGKLAKEKASTDVLRARAEELEKQAARLKSLAAKVHQQRVYDDLQKVLAGPEEKIDLIHAALLLAKLDNEDVDVDAYRGEVERMAKKAADGLAKDATDEVKLKALNAFFFEKRGFHGSRGDYYNRSNSYLNEVIDDREGLPISLCVLYMDLARRLGVHGRRHRPARSLRHATHAEGRRRQVHRRLRARRTADGRRGEEEGVRFHWRAKWATTR